MLRDVDFFILWRYLLGWVVTIYATVLTLQSLWGWYVWLIGGDRYISLVRQYLIVHGLRLRFKTFWGDVLICALLCVAFLIMWHAHGVIDDLGRRMNDVRRISTQSR
ncbi:MAG TPA: hypothetical protein VER17_15100 [Tepidisphaeraceae bacterium]|nr:hypothetical protein [Tepidisphaeraceae bacterium]